MVLVNVECIGKDVYRDITCSFCEQLEFYKKGAIEVTDDQLEKLKRNAKIAEAYDIPSLVVLEELENNGMGPTVSRCWNKIPEMGSGAKGLLVPLKLAK